MSNIAAYQLVTIGSDGEPTFDGSGNPQATGSVITLGVPRWGRRIGIQRDSIVHETERGRRWVYRRFERRTWQFVFRTDIPTKTATLAKFRALDQAVDGDADPFLFYPDFGDSPLLSYFVRLVKDFDEGTEQAINTGSIIRSTDYELILSEEPTGNTVAI